MKKIAKTIMVQGTGSHVGKSVECGVFQAKYGYGKILRHTQRGPQLRVGAGKTWIIFKRAGIV